MKHILTSPIQLTRPPSRQLFLLPLQDTGKEWLLALERPRLPARGRNLLFCSSLVHWEEASELFFVIYFLPYISFSSSASSYSLFCFLLLYVILWRFSNCNMSRTPWQIKQILPTKRHDSLILWAVYTTHNKLLKFHHMLYHIVFYIVSILSFINVLKYQTSHTDMTPSI